MSTTWSWDKILGDASKGVTNYLSSGEWVGDVMAGVGGGILMYQQQKDAEELAKRQNQWQNERYYAQGMSTDGYDSHLPLADGRLTGGGLLTGGGKKK